jgi:hypothetical protein
MAEKEVPPSYMAVWLYGMSAVLSAYCIYVARETGIYLVPGLILAVALALLLPPARKLLRVKLDLHQSRGIGAVLLFGIALAAGGLKYYSEEAAKQKLLDDSAARIAKVRADREAEFANNKAKIIAEVEQQIAGNQAREGLATINKFMSVTKDPDLGRLQRRAEVKVMRLDLEQNEKGLPPEQLQAIYTTLMQEEPGNKQKYQAKLKKVEELLEAKRIVAEANAKKAALEEKAKRQFSPFDGSHGKVEDALKSALKNPDSYEHVKTQYIVKPNEITVFTTYRARNSFNAVLTETAVATVDGDGNVLSLRTAR